jgi:hypothetical protein
MAGLKPAMTTEREELRLPPRLPDASERLAPQLQYRPGIAI